MSTEMNWKLLASYVAGECSEEEERKVRVWLRSSPDNETVMASLEKIWRAPAPAIQKLDKEKFRLDVMKKIGSTRLPVKKARISPFIHHIGSSRILKIAAVLLIAISLSYLINKVGNIRTSLPQMKEIVVEKTKRTTVTLADGSRVRLDAGSVLSYTPEVRGQIREVFLQGEGCFEVSPGAPPRPFIIHANDAVIKVLGTKFNVRAWPRYGRVQVAVVEGQVSLRSQQASNQDAVIISKGQLSVLYEKARPTVPRRVDVGKHLAWLNHEMIFQDAPLYEVLDQLNRWYDLQFDFTDNTLASLPLTTHIKNEPVEDILNSIAIVMDLEYKRSGNKVVFSPKGNS